MWILCEQVILPCGDAMYFCTTVKSQAVYSVPRSVIRVPVHLNNSMIPQVNVKHTLSLTHVKQK